MIDSGLIVVLLMMLVSSISLILFTLLYRLNILRTPAIWFLLALIFAFFNIVPAYFGIGISHEYPVMIVARGVALLSSYICIYFGVMIIKKK
jgi:hypothetical protein